MQQTPQHPSLAEFQTLEFQALVLLTNYNTVSTCLCVASLTAFS